jgi:hypothetical protein
MARMKRVLIQVEESDFDRATEAAKEEGASFAGIVRRLIKAWLRRKQRSDERLTQALSGLTIETLREAAEQGSKKRGRKKSLVIHKDAD